MKQKKMMMQQDSSRGADDAALKPESRVQALAALKPFLRLSEAFKGCRVQHIRKSPESLAEALKRACSRILQDAAGKALKALAGVQGAALAGVQALEALEALKAGCSLAPYNIYVRYRLVIESQKN